MVYHITDQMKEVILQRLEDEGIIVNLKREFEYNGYKIDLVKRTIQCTRPVKCIVKKGGT